MFASVRFFKNVSLSSLNDIFVPSLKTNKISAITLPLLNDDRFSVRIMFNYFIQNKCIIKILIKPLFFKLYHENLSTE